MTKRAIPEADETRAGHRWGEGAESVLQQLIASAQRRQKRAAPAPDSYIPTQPPADSGFVPIDIPLPP